MTFEDLEFKPLHDGVGAKAFFENGYGASVIRHKNSYGSSLGLYELAVTKGDAGSWELCYTTPITDDVIGFLTTDDVTTLLNQIEALPCPVK